MIFMVSTKYDNKFQKAAYGKPKPVKGLPPGSNTAANIGIKVVQITRVRPLLFGYKRGKQ